MLAAIEQVNDNGDLFTPQAIAAAVPPLAQWKDPQAWPRLRDALLTDVNVGDPRGFIMFRAAVVLAVRLKQSGDAAAADALLGMLQEKAKGSATAMQWVEDARRPE